MRFTCWPRSRPTVEKTSSTLSSPMLPTRCTFIAAALLLGACRYWPLCALDLDAIAEPLMRPVVPDRAMLRAAVVPERDRVLAPVKAHLPLRTLDVLEQEFQQRIALA